MNKNARQFAYLIFCQNSSNFWPFWVARERNKINRPSKSSHDRHSVLVFVSHITWPANESRWQNDQVSRTKVFFIGSVGQIIDQPLIAFHPQATLVVSEITKALSFHRTVCVNQVLLVQFSAVMNRIEMSPYSNSTGVKLQWR